MTAIPHTDAAGPSWTDAQLARAAAAGDRRAFAAIYDRFADRLHDFCVGMLRDRDAAADCVQDTFCTAATTLGGLREPDKLRPWLYAIARNEALRRLRDRGRERPSDQLPDAATQEAGGNTIARRNELADLIAEAAGGLSDRDRLVLELAYRHGMDGPEMAEALGVSQTNAGTLVHRLRDTIERCLGALLVARRVRSNPARCPQLAALLHGWDGRFTVLIRKRAARHIESCPACDRERRRLVSPAALLGAPVFIPAPQWLRDKTIAQVELTGSSSGMAAASASTGEAPGDDEATTVLQAAAGPLGAGADAGSENADRRLMLLLALLIGIPLLTLGMALAWRYAPDTPIAPIGETETSLTPIPTSGAAPSVDATSTAPPANPTTRPQQPTPTRAQPNTTAAPDPDAGRTATATPPPSGRPGTATPAPTFSPTPVPTVPAPTPPPGDMQAPPPTSAPAPATTYVPVPAEQPPPAQTYKPGPYYEPTFVPPR